MKKRIISGIMLALLFGSMLFSAIVFVEGEEETHDLEVSLKDNLKAPHHLSSGRSATLNATVVNKGNVPESDVILQLWINDTKVLESITPTLSPGKTFWSAYSWTPENGIWNLTARSPPVSGEDNVSNNVATKLVKVCADESPIACFTYSPPPPLPGWIKDEIVTFNASCSYDPDWGEITKYCWSFNGTKKNVTDSVTTYTFTKHGQATVTLYLLDTEGMTSYTPAFAKSKVYARPVPDFTVSGPPYVNYTLTFDASSSYDHDGFILNYTWDFDDGNIGKGLNITHTYTDVGTYIVRLTVTDNDNLNGSKTQNIAIGPGYPKADFIITNPEPYYVNESLTFDASISTPNGGDIVGYSWDFDDGNVTSLSNPVIPHTFTEPRTYNVNLTVVDEKGLTDCVIKPVKVILRVNMTVEPESIQSDPGEVFSVNVTITYVEDLESFKFKLSWPPDWLPPHNHLLQYDSATEGDFLGPQTYPNGTIRWVRNYLIVGAGYVFINYSFTPVVPKAERSRNGTLMTIRFLVLSSGNATLDLSETGLSTDFIPFFEPSVEDGYFHTKKPVANFTYSPDPAIANITVTFNASLSYDPDNGTITEFLWDFGDGNVTSISNPVITHTYTDAGTFNVNLTVTDDDEPTHQKWSIPKPVTVISCRDVAVISINLWANVSGEILPINVTIKNEGGWNETFGVKLYYSNITGSYFINETIVNLAPNDNITLRFNWTVSCVAMGNYTIKAVADIVPFEENTANNNCTSGLVTVTWLGDLDGDGDVDEDDLWHFCGAFITYYKIHVKDPVCDLDCDCDIDEDDLWTMYEGFINYQKRIRC